MPLHERIIAYVSNHYPLSMSALEGIVLSKGFTIDDFYTALEKVHKDKRIVQSTRRDEVWYSPAPEPTVVKTPTHVEWLTTHYPYPDNFEMPFPEINMSYLFLKTKEERDAFRAEMSGRPMYMVKSKYAKTNKR
jgi:hypothetical protein